MKIDWAAQKNLGDVQDLGQARQIILSLVEQNEILAETVKTLTHRVKELEAKLSKNSKNSSQPPSSDGYSKPKPKSLRKKSGKKSGGQPGHKGHRLERISDPDNIEYHAATICNECGHDCTSVSAKSHDIRQVHDIPPLSIEVTDHYAEVKKCPCCASKVKGQFPQGVTHHVQYGQRVRSLIIYLNQYQLIPYKRLKETLADLYNLHIREGTVCNVLEQMHNKLPPMIESIKNDLLSSELAHFDETGIRAESSLHWVHVASNEETTLYYFDKERGVNAMNACEILPNFTGIGVHDGLKSYYQYLDFTHALCNAHHLRELIFAHEQYQQIWASKLIDCLLDINAEVEQAKETGHSCLSEERQKFHSRKYSRILHQGTEELPILPETRTPTGRISKKSHKVANLHNRLKTKKKQALLFMYDFIVPFDNNLAERDVRFIKVKQKISGCFRSINGGIIFCTIRSYISTVRKRKLNVMDSIRNVFQGQTELPSAPLS